MAYINDHYLKLKAGYLFPEIAKRVKVFQEQNPKAKIIRLGIGDVVLPLPQAVTDAMHKAVDEMADQKSFKGYGPEQGYPFLREAIAENDYQPRGVKIDADEIFISDGSKCDSGNIQELFSQNTKIAVTDPVYPVYVDTNVMAGRTGEMDSSGRYQGMIYLPSISENNFTPSLPKEKVELIYLCSPNNPTGTVLDKPTLKKWVEYAQKNKAIILFDAAYEAFIKNKTLPHSIFEISGADEVALELRSFSKNAGFTGTRCAFMVIPKKLNGMDAQGNEISIHKLWSRRHTTKFNGVSYIVQKGAAACYSNKGKKQIQELVNYYMENAQTICKGLTKAGFQVYGGENAPYIWLKTPKGRSSWEFFDTLLKEAHVVGTPGSGFGPSGEGYFRFSAFGLRDQIKEAVERIKNKLGGKL